MKNILIKVLMIKSYLSRIEYFKIYSLQSVELKVFSFQLERSVDKYMVKTFCRFKRFSIYLNPMNCPFNTSDDVVVSSNGNVVRYCIFTPS